jgi:hypothetical protein
LLSWPYWLFLVHTWGWVLCYSTFWVAPVACLMGVAVATTYCWQTSPQVICRAFCWLLGWLVMQVGKTPWGYFGWVPPVVQFLQSMAWGWLAHCMASWGCALPIGGLL